MSLYYTLNRLDKIEGFFANGTLPRNLLVALVALGILFILILVAVIIYFMLKIASKKKASVEIIEKVKPSSDDAKVKDGVKTLPIGTALKDGLYEVEAYIESSNKINIYRIRRTQPLYLCSHCNSELDNDTAAFCRVCGAALGVIPPSFSTYLLRESATENVFLTAQRILGMNLHHPSLILPLDAFSDSVNETTAYYLVEPFEQSPALSAAKLPLPIAEILDIGVNLAEGLAYLHRYSAVLKYIELNRVVYTESAAKWMCYGNVDLLSIEEDPQFKLRYSDNVRMLIALLKRLLVGIEPSVTPTPVPDEVQELFSHYSAEKVNAESLTRSLRQANRMLGGHNWVQYYLGMKSDVGRLRKLNEDSMLLRDLSSQFIDLDVSMVIAAVADGVGGQAAGDVASQLTVKTLETHIDELLDKTRMDAIPDSREWLNGVVNAANDNVYNERTKAGNNMASTLVLALFTGDLCTILNVGDSRAYLMNKRGIRQITTDHSLVERLVAIGEITREEARHHPRKSVIYRVIGDRINLDVDAFTQTFEPGEAILMCSDGLTDMVEDATIWRIWRAASSPQDAAEKLVAEANTTGGTDNITVVIVEVAK